jgi:hypothetical protein
MPDALSRRADYYPTPDDKSLNFAQALPEFKHEPEKNEDASIAIKTDTDEYARTYLRALQRHADSRIL